MKSRIMKSIFILLLVPFFLISCSEDEGIDKIIASIHNNTVVLSNGGKTDLYYLVIERGTTALIDWVPSVSDESVALSPGESVTIPFGDITGYKAGDRELILYYWESVTVNGEKVAGEVHNELLIIP